MTSTDFVALVGFPNSGKTTLYNRMTGASFRTVNYPGATVDISVGATQVEFGPQVRLIDTPGAHSLSPKSPEEEVTRNVLYQRPGAGPARVVVAVIDSSQLTRHLFMAKQLKDAGFRVVVALTMSDILDRNRIDLDVETLRRRLGSPVVAVSGITGRGMGDLIAAVRGEMDKPRQLPTLLPPGNKELLEREQHEIAAWAEEASRKTSSAAWKKIRWKTERFDRVVLHPFFGLLLFVAAMAGVFTSIFWLAAPLMNGVDKAFGWTMNRIVAFSPGALWTDLLANGIVGGVGAVLVFVPQILILFFCVTLLEESGYLSRAASIVDKPLALLGLSGRSFVPLLSGFACAIPAMLAARTIPGKKSRWITLFVIPLMSCSARLPVYALLLAFLFQGEPAWKPGLAMAALYFFGLFAGALAAGIANRFSRSPAPSFFMMELPAYHRPHWRSVLKTVTSRTEGYVRKAGPAIFLFALILWAASTFPNFRAPTSAERLRTSYAAMAGRAIEPVMDPMGGDWRTATALISAFAAREVFVSALVIVMNAGGGTEASLRGSLLHAMDDAVRPDGSLLFTPASVIGLLLFFVIALQCMSTVSVGRREFGSWKGPLTQLVAFNVVAYAVAVAAVQGLRAMGVP